MDMVRSARLFLCVRRRDQVLMCSHCDRGQLYCSRACSFAARRERRQESAKRYQDSRGGRLKHAARMASWRARRRSLRQTGFGADTDKVTHQGCPGPLAGALLLACDTPSVSEITTVTGTELAAPAKAAISTAAPLVELVCRRCAHALLAHVRLHWLRGSGVRGRSGHDHHA